MKKIELLAPGGDYETAKAAIDAGADAVYVGGKAFGARAYAGNLTLKQMQDILFYAHVRKKTLYVTVNTLLKNDEYKAAFEYVSKLHSLGVDAVIVQDLSFAQIVKKQFPDMEVHASTQTSIHNSASIRYADFFDRFVLPRELNKKEIEKIIRAIDKPIEMFVHGALCNSFSGQCLMSSMIGGRSGNRGRCAQPCRKSYNKHEERQSYLLSTADLSLVHRIPEIIELGVHSLKIEGRMKPQNYVETVVSVYRKVIDSYYSGRFHVSKKDDELLIQAFNRSFTEGYFMGEKNITAPKTPSSRAPRKKQQVKYAHVRADAELSLILFEGKQIKVGFRLSELDIKEEFTLNIKPERAKKNPLTIEDIKNVFDKTKETSFRFIYKNIELGEEVFIPFSKLAVVRDECIKRLEQDVIKKNRRKKIHVELPFIQDISCDHPPKMHVLVHDKRGVNEAINTGADYVYYNIFHDDFFDVWKGSKDSKTQVFPYVPFMIFDDQINQAKTLLKKTGCKGIFSSNLGMLDKGVLKELGNPVLHLDYSFNLFNDWQLSMVDGLGVISPEVNFKELNKFKIKRFMVFSHGRIIMMKTRNPIRASELVDEKGMRFQVRKNPAGYYEILNAIDHGLFSTVQELEKIGIKHFYLDLNNEIGRIVTIYKKILNHEPFDDTKIKRKYTRGHMFRGVM